MAKPKLMGIREYARHRGVRHRAVQAAVEAGRIPFVSVKGKPMIDWRAADRGWDENTDPSKQNRKAKGVKSSGEGDATFAQARAVRETFNAKLTALKYERAASESIPVAQVKDQWFKIARTVRDSLMNAPDRLASVGVAALGVPDKDFKLNALWRDEIRLILEEMSNAAKRYGLEKDDDATEE